jgi:trigger factor
MQVEVVEVDPVKKKIEVILPEEKIREIREEIYNEVKKSAKIKGFRPGKIPRPIITSYYKEFIDEELKKRVVQNTMVEALANAKVEPVTEPIVDFIEEEGRFGYSLECEVLPEFELPVYKGIEVEVEPITVTDEEVEARAEGLRQMHAEMISREEDALAQKGDFVVVKYQGYRDGKPLKEVATEAYPLELGTTTLMPEFENALIGMKSGEEKEVEIKFPDDYPDKDIASRTILFKVFMKEIREKRLPDVNDEFAKDLDFENLEALRIGLKQEIEKEKQAGRKQYVSEKIVETLVEGVTIPVPRRLLDKRLDMMIQDAKARFNMSQFSEEEGRKIEGSMRTEFESKAAEKIRAEMILSKISEKEGITVGDEEVQERLKKIAIDAKRSFEEIRKFYDNYRLLDNLKDGLVQEKTIGFLNENAIVREKA